MSNKLIIRHPNISRLVKVDKKSGVYGYQDSGMDFTLSDEDERIIVDNWEILIPHILSSDEVTKGE